MSLRPSLAAIVALCLVGLSPTTLRADSLREMLEVGWGKPYSSREPTEQIYRDLRAQRPTDADVPYAYALVHIKQNRLREAGPILDEALRLAPSHLPSLKARAWVSIAQKDGAKGLAALEGLTRVIAAKANDPAVTPEETQELGQAAAFVGRMLAFVAGPGKGGTADNLIRTTRQNIESTLPTGLVNDLQTGEAQLTQRYQELALELEATTDQERREAEVKRQSEMQKLSAEDQQLRAEGASLAETSQAAASEYEKVASSLQQDRTLADARLAEAESRRQYAANEYLRADSEVARWYDLADRAENPFDRDYYLRQGDRARANALQARGVLAAYTQERDAVARVVQDLAARQNAAAQQYRNQQAAYQKEQRRIEGTLGRISRDVQTLNDPNYGLQTPRLLAAGNRLSALTTYDEFPVERERMRLMAGGN